MSRRFIHTPAIATGTLIRKISRHEVNSTSAPPSSGPSTEPSRPNVATVLIARTNSRLSMLRTNT
ncbi:hypothetical protein RLIN73S_04146 [Rhodanobacter lindaniclasticus]